jgi:hypothetical protein
VITEDVTTVAKASKVGLPEALAVRAVALHAVEVGRDPR